MESKYAKFLKAKRASLGKLFAKLPKPGAFGTRGGAERAELRLEQYDRDIRKAEQESAVLSASLSKCVLPSESGYTSGVLL